MTSLAFLTKTNGIAVRIVNLHFVHAPRLLNEAIPEVCLSVLKFVMESLDMIDANVATACATIVLCVLFRRRLPKVNFGGAPPHNEMFELRINRYNLKPQFDFEKLSRDVDVAGW